MFFLRILVRATHHAAKKANETDIAVEAEDAEIEFMSAREN